jgi:predicted nucleotidyltransferase
MAKTEDKSGHGETQLHWRTELHRFADDVLRSFAEREDVHGVALGGSLARGLEWKHSDVELAILVDRRLDEFGHFAVREGRGFEIFQFVEAELRGQIDRAQTDPTAVLDWPIQIYQCRVIADPSGLLGQFKEAFDRQLFSAEVISAKVARSLEGFDREFATAQADLAASKPLTALAQLRAAFNHLILAFYWRHEILPRSQNRTEALLRMHCRRLGKMDFYALFHDVYDLDLTAAQARGLLASCRAEVNDIVAGFGPAAADFFYHAVDGEFRWGQTKGILTVYRLYVPWCLRRVQKQEGVFDSSAWREAHADLCRFVGLDRPDAAVTTELLARAQAYRARLAV